MRSKRTNKESNKIRGIPGHPEIKHGDLVEFLRTKGHDTLNEVGVISFEVEAPCESFLYHYIINATFSLRSIFFSLTFSFPNT